MSQINSFEEYGREYQLQLFNELVTDHKFGLTIIDILEPSYFTTDVFNKLATLIKRYHTSNDTLLNFPGLKIEINTQVSSKDETLKIQLLDTVNDIEKFNVSNLNVQNKALKFCRFKKLKETLDKIQNKVERNLIEEYEVIEGMIKDCFDYKLVDDPIKVFDNVDKVLDEETRDVIPTGIDGIDEVLHGGLARGEVALVIAPLGVGKTTFLSKVANTAYQSGRNVLQIFFEDKYDAVQRKHYTAFTGINLNDLSHRREDVKKILKKSGEMHKVKGNDLNLLKMPADGVTVNKIKNIIKRLNSKGPKIDVLILDYIDCLSAEKEVAGQEDWSNEGKIMRQFEMMCEEMNVAGWTATQGGRSSTSIEVVRVENMGGNLKKAQIAHFIMSIGKTLEQKESKVATISILKNRMGDDGMVFANCKFDNGLMLINTNDRMTEMGFEEHKANQLQKKVKDILKGGSTNKLQETDF